MKLTKKNEKLLKVIATETTEKGFGYAAEADCVELAKNGLVEVNTSIANDESGNVAVRCTPAGFDFLKGLEDGGVTPPEFQIASNIDMPAIARTTPVRTSKYPFERLEVGQSFFIAATEEVPNPMRSYASAVTGANKRFAEEVPGETRVNRKGNTVPLTRQTREFSMRRVADGAPWGQHGATGVAVWRVL